MRVIYLASQSPRRQELLRQIGVPFEVFFQEIDEMPKLGEVADQYVIRMAMEKAQQTARLKMDYPVLAADTAVIVDDRILGKPVDEEETYRFLSALSGKTHRVMSAVALAHTTQLDVALSISEVTFRLLQENEIRAYIQTGEPKGKAGGYAIQGFAAQYISHLSGSYSGVMGLPLYETAELLKSRGLWGDPVR